MGVYMKRVAFSIEGKRFDIELEDGFANFLSDDLIKNEISFDRDNPASKLLKSYLKSLKQNYDNQKRIEELLQHISTFSV